MASVVSHDNSNYVFIPFPCTLKASKSPKVVPKKKESSEDSDSSSSEEEAPTSKAAKKKQAETKKASKSPAVTKAQSKKVTIKPADENSSSSEDTSDEEEPAKPVQPVKKVTMKQCVLGAEFYTHFKGAQKPAVGAAVENEDSSSSAEESSGEETGAKPKVKTICALSYEPTRQYYCVIASLLSCSTKVSWV